MQQSQAQDQISCPICFKKFTTKGSRRKHNSRDHPDKVAANKTTGEFKCQRCKICFTKKTSFDRHLHTCSKKSDMSASNADQSLQSTTGVDMDTQTDISTCQYDHWVELSFIVVPSSQLSDLMEIEQPQPETLSRLEDSYDDSNDWLSIRREKSKQKTQQFQCDRQWERDVKMEATKTLEQFGRQIVNSNFQCPPIEYEHLEHKRTFIRSYLNSGASYCHGKRLQHVGQPVFRLKRKSRWSNKLTRSTLPSCGKGKHHYFSPEAYVSVPKMRYSKKITKMTASRLPAILSSRQQILLGSKKSQKQRFKNFEEWHMDLVEKINEPLIAGVCSFGSASFKSVSDAEVRQQMKHIASLFHQSPIYGIFDYGPSEKGKTEAVSDFLRLMKVVVISTERARKERKGSSKEVLSRLKKQYNKLVGALTVSGYSISDCLTIEERQTLTSKLLQAKGTPFKEAEDIKTMYNGWRAIIQELNHVQIEEEEEEQDEIDPLEDEPILKRDILEELLSKRII